MSRSPLNFLSARSPLRFAPHCAPYTVASRRSGTIIYPIKFIVVRGLGLSRITQSRTVGILRHNFFSHLSFFHRGRSFSSSVVSPFIAVNIRDTGPADVLLTKTRGDIAHAPDHAGDRRSLILNDCRGSFIDANINSRIQLQYAIRQSSGFSAAGDTLARVVSLA